MASLADVANELKGILEDVRDNTATTADRVQQTNDRLDNLNAKVDEVNAQLDGLTQVLAVGLANLSQGLGLVIDRQDVTNHLLDANREQNDTIICWLAAIADVLCRSLHRQNTQVELQRELVKDLARLTAVTELAHPRETLDVSHRDDLDARIEACCPPEPERPEDCYDACRTPDFRPRQPKDSDWRPLPQPDPQPPIG
jgi:hypothetical protein